MLKLKSQGEEIKVFTLMIPEIANQMVKISPTLKTCDMSRHPPGFGCRYLLL
jgi:hypothetical protein